MTRADELAREIERVAEEVFCIQALSRTQPHIFCEQKDAASRRLRQLAAEVRNTFAGPPSQFRTGRVVIASKRHVGREVRVETRRAAA